MTGREAMDGIFFSQLGGLDGKGQENNYGENFHSGLWTNSKVRTDTLQVIKDRCGKISSLQVNTSTGSSTFYTKSF